jgi:hypothetical protein
MLLVKAKIILPIVLMVVFALSRWPGLMPWNFSAAYALMFCAGVYFPKRLAWWLPMATMLVSDLLLNWYYHAHYGTPIFSADLLGNYVAYLALVWLGRRFSAKSPFLSLLGGGILGALLFYLITNTLSWFFNPFQAPEYTKNLIGWLIALTKGTANYSYPIKMQTWELFRNTLTSGGLFTGLFAGAMKLMEAVEPAEEKEEEPAAEKPEERPEEAKAS